MNLIFNKLFEIARQIKTNQFMGICTDGKSLPMEIGDLHEEW
jgi:hypothetical protein